MATPRLDIVRFISGEVLEVKLVTGGTAQAGEWAVYSTGATGGGVTGSAVAAAGEIVAGIFMSDASDSTSLGTVTVPVFRGLARVQTLNTATSDVGKDMFIQSNTVLSGTSANGSKAGFLVSRESAAIGVVYLGQVSLGE